MNRKLILGAITIVIAFSYLLLHSDFLREGLDIIESKHSGKTVRNIESHYRAKKVKRAGGKKKLDSPDLYAQIERERRTPLNRLTPNYSENNKITELEKAQKKGVNTYKKAELDFLERGPGNVGGRTRSILVDPRDPTRNTWMAGSATGGVWKTTDAGQNWVNMTDDLPNLGTSALGMSPNNPDVIYAGTGEHFTRDIDGAGLFKSEDNGLSWTQIASPKKYPDMKNVSRIIVDPNDENIIVLTSRNTVYGDEQLGAIYKSIDGGMSWNRVVGSNQRFDDIDFQPDDFNIQYVSVLGEGVYKSFDAGQTWTNASEGLAPSGRLEITVSPVNSDRIWASVQGNQSGNRTDIYVSSDAAASWQLITDDDQSNNPDIFNGQGWYDNIITAHPFDEDVAYIGGINIFKYQLNGAVVDLTQYDVNVGGSNIFDFINFTSNGPGRGIAFGDGLQFGDSPSVEIRVGQGTQLAHRFTVDFRGSGVPDQDYIYHDYVEVPFTLWDTERNIQLMASFRDQQEDSTWNLLPTMLSGDPAAHSREYLFVHSTPYDSISNPTIAQQGGQASNQLYFMWAALQDGNDFDPEQLAVATIAISKQSISGLDRIIANISDAYFDFGGNNNFSAQNFLNNEGNHPDQHNIIPLVNQGDTSGRFRLLFGNDGGLYQSNYSVDPGTQDSTIFYAGYGYNTSQFYGADKAPGEDRYVGGMQDNSTWFTPKGSEGSASTNYEFAFGGDGFEAVWNNRDPNLIIGTSQFNGLSRTIDGGKNWFSATQGIDDRGPFRSRVTNSKANPDKLYTVGSSGAWVSENFGEFWTPTNIDSLWSFNNSTDIEVSGADNDVIWAGGFMAPFARLFVSTDGGATFDTSSYYELDTLGLVSGIGTHPTQRETAFTLFSFSGLPKVLRTSNLGESWEDISGFHGNDGVSDRGFPNVATNALLVFPNDPNRIWVGTEIGIVESLDNGNSWSLLESNLPAVNVYDFKIQDDQVVIATYGRGIWSVQIEGINQNYVFGPLLREAVVGVSGTLSAAVAYLSKYDSVQVRINQSVIASILNQEPGEELLTIGKFEMDTTISVDLIGYIDSIAYPSLTKTINVFSVFDPVAEYFNDLASDEKSSDFIGDGFSAHIENGFLNKAIQSNHNYSNNTNDSYLLKVPIIVSKNQTFSYKDVAIIEPGEDNSVFGDRDFYDYVIAEGSKDGLNWKPLANGYDSRFNNGWLDVYENEENGRGSLFVNHELDLATTFEVGDTIFIRYRLFADPGANGWGWAIDNIDISIDQSTPTVEIELTESKIYPSPATDMLNIEITTDEKYEQIELYNISGQKLLSIKVVNRIHQIDVSQLESGIYLVKLAGQEDSAIKKVIIN